MTGVRGLAAVSAREAGRSAPKADANVGVSRVPDARLDRLTALFEPKKRTPAVVEFADLGAARAGSAQSLLDVAPFRNADALVHVLRLFRDESVPHPKGSIDPARDSRAMEEEMILADLGVAERRLERLEKDLKKSASAELKKEQELLLRCRSVLESGEPLRAIELEPEDAKRLRGFQFLSAKPLLLVFNVDEAESSPGSSPDSAMESGFSRTTKTLTVVVCAKIELEIAQLEPADAAAFLADLGLAESGLDRVIRASYDCSATYPSSRSVPTSAARGPSLAEPPLRSRPGKSTATSPAASFAPRSSDTRTSSRADRFPPAGTRGAPPRRQGLHRQRTGTSSISGSRPDGAPRQRLDRHPRLRGSRGHRRASSPRWPTPRPGARFSSSTTGRPIETGPRAKAAGARVIRHPYNKGNGAAVKTGIRQAAGEYIMILDADGQHRRDRRRADRRAARRVRSRRRRARIRRRMPRSSARLGNAGLNWLSSYLAGRRHPGSDVRLAGREARVSLRVPAPAPERLLDADHHDAGVSAGGIQRGVRADRGRQRASDRRKSA